MEKFSLLTKLAKCTLNIALKLTKMSPVFHPDDILVENSNGSPHSVRNLLENKGCRAKKYISSTVLSLLS